MCDKIVSFKFCLFPNHDNLYSNQLPMRGLRLFVSEILDAISTIT